MAFVLSLTLPSPAHPELQECLHEISRWSFGPVEVLTADDDAVYFNSGTNLVVASVDSPESLTRRGHIDLEAQIDEILVRDGYALVITSLPLDESDIYNLRLIDVADPEAPVEIANPIDIPNVIGIAAAEDLVTVVSWTPGLWNPAILHLYEGASFFSLSHRSSTEPPAVGRILAISGDLLFSASWSCLRTFDISDRDAPAAFPPYCFESSPFGFSRVFDSITPCGDFLYALTIRSYDRRFTVFDVSDPAVPVETAAIEVDSGNAFQIVENTAYLTSQNEGLLRFDISDPPNPVALPPIEGLTDLYNLVQAPDVFASLGLWHQVVLIDMQEPEVPRITDSIDTPGWFGEIATDGNLVFAAEYPQGIRVFRPEDDGGLAEIGFVETRGNVSGLATTESLLLAASRTRTPSALEVFMLRRDAVPEKAGQLDLPWHPNWIAPRRSRAYVAGGQGISIIDISDPWHPQVVGSYYASRGIRSVVVVGDHAYFPGEHGSLQILDISDESTPRLVASGPHISGSHLAWSEHRPDVLFSSDAFSVESLDLSNPTDPRLLHRIFLEDHYYSHMDVAGNLLIGPSGLVLNASDPGNLRVVDDITIPFAARENLAVSGSKVFASADRKGIVVLESCHVESRFSFRRDEHQVVKFFDESLGGPAAWSWDFGDGTTSTLQNPLHAYNRPGRYVVSLEAWHSEFGSHTSRSTVTIETTPEHTTDTAQ